MQSRRCRRVCAVCSKGVMTTQMAPLDQHQAVITQSCLLPGDNLKRILRKCGFDGIAE